MNHLKSTSSGKRSRPITPEELTSSNTHDGRRPFSALSENRVPHGLVDLVGVRDGDGLVELAVDLGDEGRPVCAEVEGEGR